MMSSGQPSVPGQLICVVRLSQKRKGGRRRGQEKIENGKREGKLKLFSW
jgi:hypothetical protein